MKYHPLFVVTDYSMPVMNGATLLEKLKSTTETKDIPVIVITGAESNADYFQLRALGAADVIRKPIPLDHLLNSVKQFLSQL